MVARHEIKEHDVTKVIKKLANQYVDKYESGSPHN